jgi:hypothetical protein
MGYGCGWAGDEVVGGDLKAGEVDLGGKLCQYFASKLLHSIEKGS